MQGKFEVTMKATIYVDVNTSDYYKVNDSVGEAELRGALDLESIEITDWELEEVENEYGEHVRDTSHNPASERY